MSDPKASAVDRIMLLIRDEKADAILLCASVARELLEAHGNEPAYKQAAFEIESLLLAAADRVKKGQPFMLKPGKA